MIRLNFYEDGLLITKREEPPNSNRGRWRSVGQMVDFRTTTTRQFAHQLAQALQEAGVECELNEGLLEETSQPDDFSVDWDNIEDDYDADLMTIDEQIRRTQDQIDTYLAIGLGDLTNDELQHYDILVEDLDNMRRDYDGTF